MKVIVTIFVLTTAAAFPGSGQVNLDEIRTLTTDTSSRYYYDTLLVDFLRHPEEFEVTKAITLYYGKLYSRFYKPYHFGEDEVAFDELVKRENYSRAITVGERILERDPVNLAVLLKLLKCYFETKEQSLADLTRVKARVLHNAILKSGSGEQESSPLRVIAIADEYAVLGLMDVKLLTRSSQVYPASVMDRWKVQPKQGKKKEVWFEVLLNKEAFN